MKKSAVLLAAALLTLSLTACGRKAEQSDSREESEGTASDAVSTDSDGTDGADSAETTDGTENGEGKTLVVYYSAGGHTQKAAEYIADVTGGDTFELVPAEPYSEEDLNYNDKSSRVVYEHDNPEARVIELEETAVSDWDSYDTVFIGYPNWWADMPQALYSFFDEYDFSGKTIIPFNVHNGSRFSRTISTIQELEPDAVVIEDGFTVNERDVAEADGDVADWLEGLGF